MPVVEAQAIGKPVVCGNATSLPEVAGPAALVFDPKLPESIAAAIHQIDSDENLRRDLVTKGRVNASRFADSTAMADQYLETLNEAVRLHQTRKR